MPETCSLRGCEAEAFQCVLVNWTEYYGCPQHYRHVLHKLGVDREPCDDPICNRPPSDELDDADRRCAICGERHIGECPNLSANDEQVFGVTRHPEVDAEFERNLEAIRQAEQNRPPSDENAPGPS